ncbi:hypothetical protein [Nocardia yunnanensis]|uniref:hypothetical protein n=1 Tax=Nocardia yunnanensis TaxID=2382165 RepID=UPI0013C48C22|nr:hypothetical protein [Nocardia yunnanensis]
MRKMTGLRRSARTMILMGALTITLAAAACSSTGGTPAAQPQTPATVPQPDPDKPGVLLVHGAFADGSNPSFEQQYPPPRVDEPASQHRSGRPRTDDDEVVRHSTLSAVWISLGSAPDVSAEINPEPLDSKATERSRNAQHSGGESVR